MSQPASTAADAAPEQPPGHAPDQIQSRARENWNGLTAIVRKEIVRVLRIWGQTVVPPLITTSLYFLIFGTVIGRRIGSMDGVSYMDYIAPGLVMMSVITNAYGNVVSSFFGAKFQRHLEEILVSPLPTWVIVLGFALGGTARGVVVGLLVALVALLFTGMSVANPLLALALMVMTAFVFSLAGMVNAIYAQTFDDTTIIPNFVLTPLVYLGGVFYSISLLPELWQTVSLANPILYMVNGLRHAVLGSADIAFGSALGMVLVFAVALFSVNVWMLHRGIGIRS